MPSSSSPRRCLLSFVLPVALVLCSSACGDEAAPSGLRLELASDPALNSAAEVLQKTSNVELVIDLAGGFVTHSGGLSLRDVDGDGEAELLLTRAVEGAMPRLRLLAGEASKGRSLTLQVRGRGDDTTPGAPDNIASAGLRGDVRFQSADTAVSISVDLRPSLRPPRVDATQPAAGETLGNQDAIQIELSTVIEQNAPGAQSAIRLIADGGQSVPLVLSSSDVSYSWRTLSEKRTVISAKIGCQLGPGRYTLQVDGLRNAFGQLDQNRASATPDGFSMPLFVAGQGGAAGCLGQTSRLGEPCVDPSSCTTDGEDLVCARADANGKGVCVLRERACAELTCAPDGQVCRVVGLTASCVLHCAKRQPPACPSGQICNAQSGLCELCQGLDCYSDLCQQKCKDACAKGQQECKQCLDDCAATP